jgi:hypothetical protein
VTIKAFVRIKIDQVLKDSGRLLTDGPSVRYKRHLHGNAWPTAPCSFAANLGSSGMSPVTCGCIGPWFFVAGVGCLIVHPAATDEWFPRHNLGARSGSSKEDCDG